MKFSLQRKNFFLPVLICLLALLFYPFVAARAVDAAPSVEDVTKNAKVDSTSASLAVRVAPGELLPISVKLSNFGGGRRVDVTITYGLFNDQGNQIYTTTETVAVETTASFVKAIQVPFGTPPGQYIARTSIIYQDQLVPATAQFAFSVEKRIMGLFQSDFYLYASVLLVVSVVTGIVARIWIKRQRYVRVNPHEYLSVPKKDRIFYEIISDTIMQMRYRVGDKALAIAKSVDGLVIDENSGKVLELKVDPAKIVAQLIVQYEKMWGEKVSFAIKKPSGGSDKPPKDGAASVDKNLVFIKK